MTRQQIRDRDLLRLMGVHPMLREKVQRIMASLETLGFPMMVSAGVRTASEQFVLFKKGRRLETDSGLWVPIDPVKRTGIVTNVDGVIKRSNHQPKADGLGRACDCVFLVDGPDHDDELDTPSWDESHPWLVYGHAAEALGLRWLGRGPTLRDMPHVEELSV
jgi:peptidoglycan L-alanyl-D-glutamate endopeptidase CwlK